MLTRDAVELQRCILCLSRVLQTWTDTIRSVYEVNMYVSKKTRYCDSQGADVRARSRVARGVPLRLADRVPVRIDNRHTHAHT